MIIGNKEIFAIESSITEAYNNKNLLALGFFVIYINGVRYGVRERKATMLSCSYFEVLKRIEYKGKHEIPIFSNASSQEISLFVQNEIYNYFDMGQLKKDFGVSNEKLFSCLKERNILWTPDEDSAFDDGSHILQFDCDDKVRIISFLNKDNLNDTINTINEVYVEYNEYYNILEAWSKEFSLEWNYSRRKY